jgi:hypothetical protein
MEAGGRRKRGRSEGEGEERYLAKQAKDWHP